MNKFLRRIVMEREEEKIDKLQKKLNSYVVAISILIIAIIGVSVYGIINNMQISIYVSFVFLFFSVLNLMEYINEKKIYSLITGILFTILLLLRLI